MGLPAGGVLGIKFKSEEDYVVSLNLVRPRSDLFMISSDGKAKRTPLAEYPTQGRRGQGVISVRLGTSESRLAGACVVQANDSVILSTEKGAAKTIRAKNAPRKGRAALGQEIVALREQDFVVTVIVPSAPVIPNHEQ